MTQDNRVRKVAIVGATGTVGSFIVAELLKGGQHEVTAITRTSKPCDAPAAVKIAKVDYDEPSTLVDALRGQDALIITMSVQAPKETEFKLVEAAAAAGVPFVLPNAWSPDTQDDALADDILMPSHREVRAHIEKLGTSAWISMITGHWYEYSLGGGAARYGLDWKNRTFTFFDDGDVKMNVITWPQSGRAVAKLLSLPIEAEKAGAPSLSGYKNKFVYTSSFCVNQKDMFESVLRVSGTKASDWTIKHEDAVKRYEDGKNRFLTNGDFSGFIPTIYGRLFFKDSKGNFEAHRGLDNDALGLPKENIDEFTKIAIERAEAGVTYHGV